MLISAYYTDFQPPWDTTFFQLRSWNFYGVFFHEVEPFFKISKVKNFKIKNNNHLNMYILLQVISAFDNLNADYKQLSRETP